MVFLQSKLGNVIDIQGDSKGNGAPLDAYPKKASDNQNQQWEFVADPAGTGCFFIKSALDGNVIDIKGGSTEAGALLDAWPQKDKANENQLWWFVPDPAGSGYFFIKSALAGYVIDIQKSSTKAGALLDAFPQKASDYDNQLWKVEGGSFPPPVDTSLSFGPFGTGPAPNAPTTMSGSNEAAYQVSLTVKQDGSCTFSGYYQNRGDTDLSTAPPQSFSTGFVVNDSLGRHYGFTKSGDIPSAPQSGSLVEFNITQTCPSIAENWYPIAARKDSSYFAKNSTDMTFGDWVSSFWSTYGSDIETGIEDAAGVIEAIAD